MDTIKGEDIMGTTVNVDAVAAVDVIVNAIVLVDITVDIPVHMEKVHGEDSNPKKKKEKNSKDTKKNWNMSFKPLKKN